jgi:hypothetical protein
LILIAMVVVLTPNFNIQQIFQRIKRAKKTPGPQQ